MPGVRYGPDISDDAAYILDFVKDVQARIKAGKTIGKRDSTRYNAYREIADKLFGVGNARFDKGQFGDLAELARYGGSGKRNALARNHTTGELMKKGVDQEFADRGSGRKSVSGSSTKTPTGAWYQGRTRTKKFKELEARAMRRANRKGVKFGKGEIVKGSVNKENFKARVDNLNITKARASGSDILNRPRGGKQTPTRAGTTIRPAKARGKAAGQQATRKKTVKEAGRKLSEKGKTKKATPAKKGGTKKATPAKKGSTKKK